MILDGPQNVNGRKKFVLSSGEWRSLFREGICCLLLQSWRIFSSFQAAQSQRWRCKRLRSRFVSGLKFLNTISIEARITCKSELNHLKWFSLHNETFFPPGKISRRCTNYKKFTIFHFLAVLGASFQLSQNSICCLLFLHSIPRAL